MNENGFLAGIGPNLESAFNFLRPEPEVITEPVPELEPTPENVTQTDLSADPQPGDDVLQSGSPAPLEVVTVEDLLNRLTGTGQDEAEEPLQEGETPSEEFPEVPADEFLFNDGETVQVAGMDTALRRLETIQQAVDHPAMTTPFEDYTVTEALLLLLFLSAFVAACVKMLKGGFAWLR